MKKSTATILLIIIAFSVSCSIENKQIKPDYSFPFIFENNRIVLKANINGQNGNYVFDTGVEGIITSTSIKNLNEIEFPYDQYYLLGSIRKYKTYSIDKIKFDNITFPVSTFVFDANTKILGYDGILGGTIFKGYYVEISFSNNMIYLYKTKPLGYSQKIPIYFNEQFYPYINCNVDGIYVPFLIDTGSPLNIVFPLPTSSCIDNNKYQRIISGDKDYESYRVNIKYYDDGFRVFKNITGISNPLSELNNGIIFARSGNLGTDYLKHFNILIDYRGSKKAFLYYINRTFITNFYINRKGFWYLNGRMNAQYNDFGLDGWKIQENKLIITSVIENSKATKAGILPGTEILQINNKNKNKYTKKQIEDIFFFNIKALSIKCIINNQVQEVVFQ